MQRSIIIIVAALVLLTAANGCGGRSGVSLNPVSVDESDGAAAFTGDSPLARRALDYGLAQYPEQNGFRVVPLRDDFSQLPAAASPYTFESEDDGEKAVVRVSARDARRVLLHVRYDPAEWQPVSVRMKNAWTGAEDFASCSREFAPGALIIASVPAGDPDAFIADGPLAEADFRRTNPGTRQAGSRLPPSSGLDSLDVLWYGLYDPEEAEYTQTYTGSFTYALDGALGDASTKDGQQSTPETSAVPANLAQDVTLAPFGEEYEYSSQANLTLRFTERLTGDHDNDGVVLMADLTPIGSCWTPKDEQNWSFFSRLTAFENLSPIRLSEMMNTHSGTPWYKASRSVVSFYNFAATEGNPPGYKTRSFYVGDQLMDLNVRDTSIDSFWDGYIRDYENVDVVGDEYDHPVEHHDVLIGDTWYYHPGDSATISYSYLNSGMDNAEWIYGYEVWTLPTGSIFSSEYPPDRVNPPTDYTRVLTYLREDNYHDAPDDFEYWVSYPEKPWKGATTMRFRRTQFELALQGNSFPADATGYYDVVVVPYSFTDPEDYQTMAYGPATRLNLAVNFNPPPPPQDEYGPQYHNEVLEIPPNVTPHENYDLGLEGAVQPYYNQLLFSYWDADDVGQDGLWNPQGETVYYRIYAVSHGPGSQDPPPTPAELFTAENARGGISFHEEPTGADNGLRVKQFVLNDGDWEKADIDLPLRTPGSMIWFGIRAFDSAAANALLEYKHPGGQWPPNEEIAEPPIIVMDFEQPYYIKASDDYDHTSAPASSFAERIAVVYDGAVAIYFRPAIDPPEYSPQEEILYELFYSTTPFAAEDTLGLQPDDSRVMKYADYYDPEEPNPFNDGAYAFLIENVQEDVPYYYYVRASAPNTPSTSLAMYNAPLPVLTFTWEPQDPDEAVEPPGQEVNMAGAVCPGDIAVIDDDIHIAYVTSTGIGDTSELVYARYDDGDIETVSHYVESAVNFPGVYAGAAGAGVKLAFKLDVAANSLEYSFGKPLPLISFSGSSGGMQSLGGELYTTEAMAGSQPDDWTWRTIHHSQLGAFPYTDNPCPISYAHYDGNGSPAGLYVLGWVYDDDWRWSLVDGGVQYKHRDATSGYWTEDDEQSHILEWGNYLCWPTYEMCSDLNYRFAAQPGWTSGWPTGAQAVTSASGGNPYGNLLYVLTGSPGDGAESGKGVPIWHVIKLWKLVGSTAVPSANPLQFSSFDMLEVVKDNPDWDRGNASYGPISHEVVATNDRFTTGDIYFGFCNSAPGEADSDPDTGLRMMYATDIGSGPGLWQSPNADAGGLGIVDQDYYLASTDSVPTARIFDIAKRHESEDFPQPYDGLGCVYADHVNGELILAETVNVGGGLSWQRRVVPNRDHIDQGAINWASLAYDSDDVPYVLYARSQAVDLATVGTIYLWRRP